MSVGLTRQQIYLLAIFTLFSLPMLIAWVVYQGAGTRWSLASKYHGVLIRPPRPVSVVGLRDLQGHPIETRFVQRHWILMYVAEAPCGDGCRQALDTMRRVRLALGEDMKRVRRVYISAARPGGGGLPAESAGLRVIQAAPQWLSNFLSETGKRVPSGRIYVIDPQSLQMMFYPSAADPKGILKDLERLLKLSLAG